MGTLLLSRGAHWDSTDNEGTTAYPRFIASPGRYVTLTCLCARVVHVMSRDCSRDVMACLPTSLKRFVRMH